MQIILTFILTFISSFYLYDLMDSAKYEKLINEQIKLSTQTNIPHIGTQTILTQNYNLEIHKARVLAMVINDAALIEDIPPEHLIAVIKVESNFNHKAVSSEKAIGFAQIIPRYWNGEKGYDAYDKYDNIYLSAHVLKTYHTQLKDWDKTFKAYNVGIGNFNKKKQLSAQTRYLRKINRELNSIAVFKEERKYAKL